jgi:dolichol-phosphate mannosyltransferase
MDSLLGFSTLPLRLATAVGFLYAAAGFVYAALLVTNKLTGGRVFGAVPVTGFAALMTVLLISTGTILVVLGIFGEYLWRALEEVRGRPRFLIEESVNMDRDPS